MEILKNTLLTKGTAVKGDKIEFKGKYSPVELIMPRLPKFMIPKFATSEGGTTDTINDYVYKLSENYAQYIPRGYGYVAFYPSGLEKTAQALYVVSRFLQFLEGGQIALIYDKINLHFSTPQWAMQKDFDENYYFGANRLFLKNIIAEVVTTVNTPLYTDTVRDLVFEFMTEPNTILDSLYQAVVDNVNLNASIIKDKIDEADYKNEINKKISSIWYDPTSLIAINILKNKYKVLITEYFDQYFSVPNASVYESASIFNSGLIPYDVICSDNYKKATGEDRDIEFATLYSATEGLRSLKIPSADSDLNKNDAGGSDDFDSDRNMLIVAIALLVGIFILKRYKKG